MADTLLNDQQALDAFTGAHPIGVLYFTGPDCAVCKALKPRLREMLARDFPEAGFAEVDCAASPALSADLGVFTLPTVILFIDGRESLRRSRAFGLGELAEALQRPYSLLYS